jgi:hypothetical protein
MSIEAIEAIERHIHKRENGLPFSEIIRLCEEFVAQRDANESYNYRRRYREHNSYKTKTFAMRYGQQLERVKI